MTRGGDVAIVCRALSVELERPRGRGSHWKVRDPPHEALTNVYDAILEWINSMERIGAPIPQPRRLAA